MIETFIAKIIGVVFKKALASSVLAPAATSYEVYSVFDTVADLADCVDSANDCSELGLCGIHVVSDVLTEAVVDRLLEIGSETFVVEQTSSGLYVASREIPSFRLSGVTWPSGVSRGGAGRFSSGGKGGFSSGAKGTYRTGGR